MRRKPDVSSLLSLLDDEDESVALEAMAQLLDRGDEVEPELAQLQDSTEPLLRRRVHQLAAALTLRRRRREFSHLLEAPEPDVNKLLVELHLQWFDNDPQPAMTARLESFLAEARSSGVRDLGGVSMYMRKLGFVAEHDTTMRPEDYCIGLILSDRIGSTAMLCQLGREMLRGAAEAQVVRLADEFALWDGRALLLPERDWRLLRAPGADELERWDDRKVLKFASTMLFAAAVHTDSFRYVLTIGQALSGLPGDEVLDYLPYPYRPAPEDDEDVRDGV